MTKSVLAALSALLVAGCCAPAPSIAGGAPMGLLGARLGTYLRLQGVRDQQGKVGPRSFLVQEVGDVVLPEPVSIWVENLELPIGVRCVLSGYETGRWIGLPPEVQRAEGMAPTQAGWQFQHSFLATSVQAPPELVDRFRSERVGR